MATHIESSTVRTFGAGLAVLAFAAATVGCSSSHHARRAAPTTVTTVGLATSPTTDLGEATTVAPTQTVVLDDPTLSCAGAARRNDPLVLLRAFATARRNGHRPQDCLSATARRAYDDARVTDEDFLRSPGPKCLHLCGHYIVTEVALEDSQTFQNPDGSKTFGVTVTFRGTTQDTTSALQHLYEYLTVASQNGRQAIVDVSNN